jgi:hypothetical protein
MFGRGIANTFEIFNIVGGILDESRRPGETGRDVLWVKCHRCDRLWKRSRVGVEHPEIALNIQSVVL